MRMDPPALAQDAPGIALAGGATGALAMAVAGTSGGGPIDPLVMEDVRHDQRVDQIGRAHV